jgi:hypothetical protein
MAGVRHMLLVILAVTGLVSALGAAGAAAACPAPPPISMPAAHDDGCGHRAPVSHEVLNCAACIAVLPSLGRVEAPVPPRLEAVTESLRSLSGTDPALDPPPPRGA